MIPDIKQPKVAIVSDLHLGVHSNSSYWHTVGIEWANWLKGELNAQGITDIIFCGDWHHSRSEISVLTLQVSADILDILQEFNLIAITGNHDLYFKHRTDVNSMSIFKRRKNVTIFDTPCTIEKFGRVISFCPWNSDMSTIPKSDVLFGHLETETFKMTASKMCEEGISISEVLDIAPLAISGHFHTRQEKKFGDRSILYCGNPFQMDFGDAGNIKGYYTLDFTDMDLQFYENTVSPHYNKVNLSDLIAIGSLTDEVKEIFDGNIVRLKVDKNISNEDMSKLLDILNDLQPESLTVDYDINFNRISNEEDREDLSGIDVKEAITEFISLLDIENKKDVTKYTIDLYKKCKG